MGRLPHELLASARSDQIAELFAYFVLQDESQKPKASTPEEVEEQLKKAFGEAS